MPADIPRYGSLRASRQVLARMAPLVRFGLWLLGLALFLEQARPLLSDAQFTWGERRVMGLIALVTLVGCGVAGWVAGRLLTASAELIEVFVDGAESARQAATLVELHMVPTLVRIANALEQGPGTPAGDGRARAVAAIRQAIGDGRCGPAERLLREFARDVPAAPEVATLTARLADARQDAIADLRSRLEAARAAGDAGLVVEYRDWLTEHLRGEPLRALDRELIAWLSGVIDDRLRAGTDPEGTAALAARVADSFGDTPEGAALREALPALRRGEIPLSLLPEPEVPR